MPIESARSSSIPRISRISFFTPSDSAHFQAIVAQLPPVDQGRKADPKYLFAFSAGLSSMSNSFSLLPGLQTSNDLMYGYPVQNSGPGAPNSFYSRRPSSIRTGAAFSIGVLRQQQLGGRWSALAGFQYQYLSTRRLVGAAYSDTVIVSGYSRASLSLQNYYAASPRADEGLDYTNRYHYLTLPLQLRYDLNRRGTVRAEGGITGAALLGTNALLFDSASGIYFKDPAAHRRFSASAGAALSVDLFRIGGRPVEMGPAFQWGLVPALKGDRSRPVSLQLQTRIRL